MIRLLAALILAAGAAEAQSCVARVNAQELIIVPDAFDAPAPGMAERLTTWPRRTWDRAWGERTACDSATITRFLGLTLALEETKGFCLAEDGEEGWLLVPGEANFRGRCRVSVCERVNAGADFAGDVAAGITDALVPGALDPDSGVEAVAHGTGSLILSGRGPAVLTALGEAGAMMANPIGLTSVVAVGGAVWLCSDDE